MNPGDGGGGKSTVWGVKRENPWTGLEGTTLGDHGVWEVQSWERPHPYPRPGSILEWDQQALPEPPFLSPILQRAATH